MKNITLYVKGKCKIWKISLDDRETVSDVLSTPPPKKVEEGDYLFVYIERSGNTRVVRSYKDALSGRLYWDLFDATR